MKLLNFINAVPRKKQQAIARWYTISCIVFALAILGIGFLQVQQLYVLYTYHAAIKQARMQCASIRPLHAQLTTLKEQEQQAHTTTMRVKKIKDTYKTMGQRLHNALQACSQTALLQEYQCDNQSTTLTLHTQSSEHTLKTRDSLSALPWFANVQIASLQSTRNEKYPFLAVIKASMVS